MIKLDTSQTGSKNETRKINDSIAIKFIKV